MNPVEVESCFLGNACRRRDFIDTVDTSMFGSKLPRADREFIGNILERALWRYQQRVITDHLDRETAKLDTLMVKIQDTIAFLSERCATLIVALVTGQIDVESAA